jgi:hypothetical protein
MSKEENKRKAIFNAYKDNLNILIGKGYVTG